MDRCGVCLEFGRVLFEGRGRKGCLWGKSEGCSGGFFDEFEFIVMARVNETEGVG